MKKPFKKISGNVTHDSFKAYIWSQLRSIKFSAQYIVDYPNDIKTNCELIKLICSDVDKTIKELNKSKNQIYID